MSQGEKLTKQVSNSYTKRSFERTRVCHGVPTTAECAWKETSHGLILNNLTAMAHSKNFFGLRRGSTKAFTFQVLRGQQITKDRVTNVANPQTNAQMEQRLKMPLVASSRAVLKTLVDHSFEGVAYGEESLKQFSRLNLSKNAITVKQYVPKGAMDTGLADLIISKGSLTPQVFSFSGGDSDKGASGNIYMPMSNKAESAPTTIAELIEFLIHNGYEANDQLTFLFCYQGDEYDYTNSDGETKKAYYHRYIVSRFVLNADSEVTKKWTLNATEKSISDGYVTIPLNPSPYEQLTIIPTYEKAVEKVLSACVILSRLNDTTWQRSSQRMVISPYAYDDPTYNDVVSTYLKAGSVSSKYLNSGIDGVDITGGNV